MFISFNFNSSSLLLKQYNINTISSSLLPLIFLSSSLITAADTPEGLCSFFVFTLCNILYFASSPSIEEFKSKLLFLLLHVRPAALLFLLLLLLLLLLVCRLHHLLLLLFTPQFVGLLPRLLRHQAAAAPAAAAARYRSCCCSIETDERHQ